MRERKLLSYPMKTTVIYLLFTILLFVFGPIKWNIPSYTKLVVTLLIYIASFAMGYRYQMQKKLHSKEFPIEELSNPDSENFGFLKSVPFEKLSLIFVVSCAYSIIRNAIYTLHFYGSIDFTALLNIDLAGAYQGRLESAVQGRWYILILNYLYVFDLFWYIIGILYYKKMSGKYKLLFFATIAFNALYTVMGGTLISWAVFIFKLVPFFFLERYKSKTSTKRKDKKKSKRRTLLIIVLCLAFLMLFSYVQEARLKQFGLDADDFTYDSGTIAPFIDKEVDLPILNTAIKFMNFYLVHGYCGMAYAMELPPEFTYGIGFSRDLARNVNAFFGFDVSGFTYPQRVSDAYGWDNGFCWPSAFTWFASDWSFYGLPIFMFLFGMFLCNVWYSALYEKSIISVVLSSWLWVGIIFLPANNQLFQSFNMFMATTALLVLYLFRKQLPKIVFK